MTLCVAYIRQVGATEELVFATDSELSGGETWDKGVKLFELPNRDGLLCFTGRTARAYPLILNLINTIKYEEYFATRNYSHDELLQHIILLFTTLIRTVTNTTEPLHEVRAEARLLFGGWDWSANKFRVYLLVYDKAERGFISSELTEDEDQANFHTFIGESSSKYVNAEEVAQARLTELLIAKQRMFKKFDTEPLQVLREIARGSEVPGVGGSLQIAKVYKSSKTEFFGTYWKSAEGKPCFQGREYKEADKPRVRYFDPDTFYILESDIPNRMHQITEDDFGDDFDYVKSCYDPEGDLLPDLGEKKKHNLKLIFKDVAYRKYAAFQEEDEAAQLSEE